MRDSSSVSVLVGLQHINEKHEWISYVPSNTFFAALLSLKIALVAHRAGLTGLKRFNRVFLWGTYLIEFYSLTYNGYYQSQTFPDHESGHGKLVVWLKHHDI